MSSTCFSATIWLNNSQTHITLTLSLVVGGRDLLTGLHWPCLTHLISSPTYSSLFLLGHFSTLLPSCHHSLNSHEPHIHLSCYHLHAKAVLLVTGQDNCNFNHTHGVLWVVVCVFDYFEQHSTGLHQRWNSPLWCSVCGKYHCGKTNFLKWVHKLGKSNHILRVDHGMVIAQWLTLLECHHIQLNK